MLPKTKKTLFIIVNHNGTKTYKRREDSMEDAIIWVENNLDLSCEPYYIEKANKVTEILYDKLNGLI